MSSPSLLSSRGSSISRRSLIGASLASVALVHLPASAATVPRQGCKGGVMPAQQGKHATWTPWLPSSPSELRPKAPADPTADELAELVQLQAAGDEAVIATIKQWNSRPAVLPWTEFANAAFAEFKMERHRTTGPARPAVTVLALDRAYRAR